jgi:hypothetical protein
LKRILNPFLDTKTKRERETKTMDQHIQLYTKYIYEDLYNIDIDNATYKEHLHKSFEWFACIQLSKQHNSIFTRWEDVHPQIREDKWENG